MLNRLKIILLLTSAGGNISLQTMFYITDQLKDRFSITFLIIGIVALLFGATEVFNNEEILSSNRRSVMFTGVNMKKCEHIIDYETISSHTDNIPTDYGRWDADGLVLCPYCMKPIKDVVFEQAVQINKLKNKIKKMNSANR